VDAGITLRLGCSTARACSYTSPASLVAARSAVISIREAWMRHPYEHQTSNLQNQPTRSCKHERCIKDFASTTQRPETDEHIHTPSQSSFHTSSTLPNAPPHRTHPFPNNMFNISNSPVCLLDPSRASGKDLSVSALTNKIEAVFLHRTITLRHQ
jgi:hypothetical protein